MFLVVSPVVHKLRLVASDFSVKTFASFPQIEEAARQLCVLCNSRLFRINEPCSVNLASVIFETISLSCVTSFYNT